MQGNLVLAEDSGMLLSAQTNLAFLKGIDFPFWICQVSHVVLYLGSQSVFGTNTGVHYGRRHFGKG